VDKFWTYPEVKYDYKVESLGTRHRKCDSG